MTVKSGTHRAALTLTWSLLVASLPFVVGQGCPGGGIIQPIGGNPSGSVLPDSTGNTPPSFQFTAPVADISREVGDTITISWTASDPDSNAAITLLLDSDAVFGNGNERVIVPVILEDSLLQTYQLNTSAITPALEPGTYRIVARVNDGVNPELLVVSPGRLLLFGAGLLPDNISPQIFVTLPVTDVGVSQNDTVQIAYCASDRDNGENGVTPDIVLLLDFDNNSMNDLDLTGPDAEATLIDICTTGGFPRTIPGAIVLGCFQKTTNCTTPNIPPNANNPAAPQPFVLAIDVGLIPPRADGEPYRVRGTIWDHTNPPVSAYASGGISVTSLASGVLDMGLVGRSTSGTKFLGFDTGARAGSQGMSVGDFDGDGAGDFMIVAKTGRPFERGNYGMAYLVYGTGGGAAGVNRFASEIHLSSIGTTYRGAQFAMGGGESTQVIPATNGIESVTLMPDVTFDGRPEFMFGMSYVEQMWDYVDDDPCDRDDLCYNDLLPNPLSLGGRDDLTAFDIYDGGIGDPPDTVICSNDYDIFRSTPIDQGYVIMVSSENALEGNVIELALTAMTDPDGIENDEGTLFGGGSAPAGARFRGGWWDELDLTQTRYPYAIIPDNEFGKTVAAMPDLANGSISSRKDGVAELLISAPNSYRGRGGVSLVFGQDFSTFAGGDTIASIPFYFSVGDCFRSYLYPTFRTFFGSAIGDHLGYAGPGGDFNFDGNQDILLGAPGADRNGVTDGGIVYIFFGRLDIGDIDLATMNPPRVEIRGTKAGDAFGSVQTLVGDLNQDGVPDVGFASEVADGPGGVDSGFIGVVFGGRRLTGENVYTVGQVGTAQLPGVKFFGTQTGGRAGAVISNVGDFNGDGTDDLLLNAPGETRLMSGQTRKGIAYLIFGGPHLTNGSFNLNQVGTAQLPGVILVSPYAAGSAEEAPIDFVGAAGDVNADGFTDILVGTSLADFVNPLEPGQRRNDAGECYLIYGSNTGSNVVR